MDKMHEEGWTCNRQRMNLNQCSDCGCLLKTQPPALRGRPIAVSAGPGKLGPSLLPAGPLQCKDVYVPANGSNEELTPESSGVLADDFASQVIWAM